MGRWATADGWDGQDSGVSCGMRFELIDRVLERTDTGLTAIKQVSVAEEYLQDHFPTFPVLPGVFMLESMVHAARAFLADHTPTRMVLGRVKSLKYGHFVSPGDTMRITVTCSNPKGSEPEFKGLVLVSGPVLPDGARVPNDATAASGRFLLRAITSSDLCRGTGPIESKSLAETSA